MENIRRAAKLIRERRDQVVRLQVHLSCWSFKKILGFDWPNLKEFVWTDTCLGPSHCGGGYEGSLPRLRDLSIQGGFNWPMKTAKHLSNLKLQGPMDLEFTVFAGFLRKNTSLESLDLTDVNVLKPFSNCQEKSIELPHLNKLRVCDDGTTCGGALPLLNIPSLRRLSVVSTAQQGFLSHSPWSQFCGGLSITSLKAGYCAPPRGYATITVVGSDESGIQSLYLKELSYPGISTPLFRSLSNPSLSSVTSFSFVDDMPEGILSLRQVSAICDLLKHLSRVECMHLCPSRLAVGVVRRLRDDPELCPGLRVLGIIVTDKIREKSQNLVGDMLKSRTSGGDWWGMDSRPAICQSSSGWHNGGDSPRTHMVWEKAN